MNANIRLSQSFKNRTKYFMPCKDKTKITVSSSASWQNKCSKTDGYEARLYWHYRYCESVNGQVFYYTLTYNDASIPQYFGMNCFDYEDLRDLLTGGFRKKLLRKYGTKFKYFIGAELGDGAGSRGMHNNPHYHVLFFLEPDKDGEFPYEKISPEDFRSLVKEYWQGFDETKTGFQDYRTAKYGIAKEGLNCGLVMDFRACVYCAKYCVKDISLKRHEEKIKQTLSLRTKSVLQESQVLHKDYIESVLFPLFNIKQSSREDDFLFDIYELFYTHFPDDDIPLPIVYRNEIKLPTYRYIAGCFIEKFSLQSSFEDFLNARVEELVSESISIYRNRYCNKCRISNGVGDYAIECENLKSQEEPLISVPSKDGIKYRPLPLYYYRKLFTLVLRFPMPHQHNHSRLKAYSPIRVLNEDGLKYRLRRLDKSIAKCYNDAISNFELILSDRNLYTDMVNSDVNTECFIPFERLPYYNDMIKGVRRDLFFDFAIFKFVYNGRYFDSNNVPQLDYKSDYERFIYPSFYSVERSDIRLDFFLDNPGSCLPYSEHPYFRPFLGFFSLLELCANYFFIQRDIQLEKEAKERLLTKRFFDKQKLREFYFQFK